MLINMVLLTAWLADNAVIISIQIGESALLHATWEGHADIVSQLIAAGANVDLREKVSV